MNNLKKYRKASVGKIKVKIKVPHEKTILLYMMKRLRKINKMDRFRFLRCLQRIIDKHTS